MGKGQAFDAGSYDADVARQTLRVGRVAACFALVLLPLFAWQDIRVLGLDTLWPWRLVAWIAFAVFLIGSYTFLRNRPRLTLEVHTCALTLLVLCGAGVMRTLLAQRPDLPHYQGGASGALLDCILAAFLFAAGARRYLAFVMLAPLVWLCLSFLVAGTLTPAEWTLLSDPVVAATVTIVAGLGQDRMARAEWAALRLAEGRKREAEERLDELQVTTSRLVAEITERRILEASLAERAAELKVSNENLRQFAHVVSHDLKEPLRTVAGFVGLLGVRLKELGVEDAEIEEAVTHATAGTKRMRRLIEDLLAYAEIDARERPFRAVSIAECVECACANLAAAIQASGAEVRAGELGHAWGDPQQIMQLCQNLIGNAVKYGRAGVPPVVEVSTHDEGGAIKLLVQDNGIGIAPRDQERVFGIFQRLADARTQDGTGVGLAICRRIAEKHGGAIGVTSTLGEGSTFWVTLPTKKGA